MASPQVTIICTNSYGQGREREDVAFFGINRPGYPLNVVVKENPEKVGEVIITWKHNPLDYDGFPMNPDHITYEIIDLTGDGETTLAKDIKDTSWSYQARRPDQDQRFMRFAVRAWTVTAGSPGVFAPYISVGSPYQLPLTESFANYSPRMAMVQQSPDGTGLAMWGFNNSDPFGSGCYDNDNGMALMEAIFAGATKRLVTGKIDLTKAEKPILSVRIYNPAGVNTCTNILEIQVSKGLTDEADWESVASNTMNTWAEGEKGWQRMEVDLSYTPAGNERLQLRGYNVYLDGVKQNDEPVSGNEYLHNPGNGDHTYGVSALYNLGESPLSEVRVSFSGVDGIEAGNVRVSAGKGVILIEGAEGLDVAVYASDGKCIHSRVSDESHLAVSASAGVYLVKISGKTAKVIVR